MRSRCLLAPIVVVLAAAPCLAQGIGRPCDPSGTWIGGGNPAVPSYQLTVVPTQAGRYSITFQMIFDPGIHSTNYTGELIRNDARTFTAYAMATFGETQESVDFYASLGIDISTSDQEADAIVEAARMVDCDTMEFKINWFGWYLPITGDKIPFVTQPEVEFIHDFLGGEPMVETYHRVSGDPCPVCTIGGSVTGTMDPAALASKANKGHKKRGGKK